ncbi:hypothetical protein BKA61DRAFT_618412, partial [Leptodontidium sp. MPI-SDFR-AT-0119]
IPNPERYLSKWFLDAPASEIKRDNVKDFSRWAFFNTGEPDPVDDKELEEYLRPNKQRGRPSKCWSLSNSRWRGF